MGIPIAQAVTQPTKSYLSAALNRFVHTWFRKGDNTNETWHVSVLTLFIHFYCSPGKTGYPASFLYLFVSAHLTWLHFIPLHHSSLCLSSPHLTFRFLTSLLSTFTSHTLLSPHLSPLPSSPLLPSSFRFSLFPHVKAPFLEFSVYIFSFSLNTQP